VRRVLAGILVVAGLGLCLFGFSPFTFADGAVEVTFKILTTQELTVDPSSVTFPDMTPETPETLLSAVTVTVKSNVPYKLSYTADSHFTNTTNQQVEIGRLAYRENNSSSEWAEFHSSKTELAQSNERTAAKHYIYDYQLSVLWTDPAGDDYKADITYEVEPQSQ